MQWFDYKYTDQSIDELSNNYDKVFFLFNIKKTVFLPIILLNIVYLVPKCISYEKVFSRKIIQMKFNIKIYSFNRKSI